MAETQNHAYVGTIQNAGSQVVKAPNQSAAPAKDKVITGKDLRSGSK